MKIGDNIWSLIFIAIVVGIIAINMLAPNWIYLLISIGAIISVYLILSPLTGSQKELELENLYSEYNTLFEELKHLKKKKRKKQK